MSVVADIHLIGLAAARPAASAANNGYYYTETDTAGGTTFRSNGTTWVQIAAGASGATAPGGADKNVQYNNAAAFGGVGNNATATNKFLRQVSSGTPSMEQVADADLATTDITTNNVSITKHGFAPKASNDATEYLDGTGDWSVPAGGGGGVSAVISAAALIYANSNFS